MLVEFYRPESPDERVASATWHDGAVTVEAGDPLVKEALARAFRPTPVVVDDPALRRQGTHGDVLVQPGSLEWFRSVARVRAAPESGLSSRLVPGVTEGGYDPAAQSRTFEDSMARLTDRPD